MNILLTGSVAFDYLMTFPGYFKDHILPDKLECISLSFLVESMVRLRGGVATNIAYTLSLLGEKPRLFASVGEDFVEYRAWLESKGIDTTWTKVVPGEFTASFFANTDLSNAQIASFYPGAMAHASELSIKAVEVDKLDLVVISPNDPDAMKSYVSECIELGYRYIYDPSQQIVRFSGDELREGIEGAYALFVNDYEFALIQKMTGMSEIKLLDFVEVLVVTRGENGSDIYAKDCQFHIPVAAPKRIGDPTGVGDAFRGGFLAAHGRGLDWEMCGRVGALAATYCLEETGTQTHSYTRREFIDRFRESFDDKGKLDIFTS
jgi:adenosine kinase